MALEGHTGIGRRHAGTVVDYLNERAARIFENNRNGRGSGIDSILYQFLDYRGRTLYDFPGSYLVGHRIGQ